MRTTLEMLPEHRSKLLEIAANRGEKGFSGVVAEAIEQYLRSETERERHRKEFATLAGSLSREEADELRNTTRNIRESWR